VLQAFSAGVSTVKKKCRQHFQVVINLAPISSVRSSRKCYGILSIVVYHCQYALTMANIERHDVLTLSSVEWYSSTILIIFVIFDTEKVDGVHQLPTPAGYEEWKVRAGLQAVPEDDPPGKSQAGHPGQQLPCSQVKWLSALTVWLFS
jgi:hypothetical protein